MFASKSSSILGVKKRVVFYVVAILVGCVVLIKAKSYLSADRETPNLGKRPQSQGQRKSVKYDDPDSLDFRLHQPYQAERSHQVDNQRRIESYDKRKEDDDQSAHKQMDTDAVRKPIAPDSRQKSMDTSAGRKRLEFEEGGDPFGGMKFYDGSGNLVVQHDKWIVVTSIQAPTDDIRALSSIPGWKLVVIGDTKTPKDWKCPNAVFLDVETQKKLKLKAMQYIPYKSYSRKNIGYFFAFKHGAKLIYDTDDDNKPNDGFRSFNFEDGETSTILMIKNINNTYNPYPHFGQQTIWPRGYPIEEVSNDVPREYLMCETRTPLVRQGIVNGDPDVDAIYRLMRKHTSKRINLLFDVHTPRMIIPPKTLSPYNSQNTIHNYEAFWGLAFPVTPTLRVCDIWRGYWAQKLMWMVGGQIGFYTAGTFQFRSAHSYLKDFIDEEKLYYQAGLLAKFLMAWQCNSNDFFECIKMMSYDMAEKGFWQEEDAKFVEAWLYDLKSLGYKPPTISPITATQCATSPTNVIYYPQEQEATYGEVREYYLPPFVRVKFDKLSTIVKTNCVRSQSIVPNLSMNGSSLINDILLVVHLVDTPTLDSLTKLELFYRPRFGQILYCGKWQEDTKSVFHALRVSFAEISSSVKDPEMACLYKAADMHYIVEGYLVIPQNALLNVAAINKNRQNVWMPQNWATPSTAESQCTAGYCIKSQIDIDKVMNAIGGSDQSQNVKSCALYKPGTQFSYNQARVFYVPHSYDVALRAASKQSLDGTSMAAMMYCLDKAPVQLTSASSMSQAMASTDYVEKFDFSDMNKLCPVLGYNP